MAYRYWKEWEVIRLREMYPSGDLKKISEFLGRSEKSVQVKAHHLGLKVAKPLGHVDWTEYRLNMVKKYFPTMFTGDLSKLIGVSPRSIIRKARELGIEKTADFLETRREDMNRRASAAAKSRPTREGDGRFKKRNAPQPGRRVQKRSSSDRKGGGEAVCHTEGDYPPQETSGTNETHLRNMNLNIGLIDVDGHASKKRFGATIYPNIALAKIAAFHKGMGDKVSWYDPMFGGRYDVVYMSKVFNFTPDYELPVHADEINKGGTGYDLFSTLPIHIDECQPDFSIYPNVPSDTSYGFLTRGCPNHCKWCVVPAKEGYIRPYWDIDRVANGRRKVVLMDNNILAAGDYAKEQLRKIIDKEYIVDFNQALDARLVTPEFAELLAQIHWIDRRIRFGCDTPGQVLECQEAMDMIDGYGFKGQYFLYCMLHGTFRECYERINHWWEMNQKDRLSHTQKRVYPYAQPYRDPVNRSQEPPQWQKDMAGWVNKKMIFETVSFEDFEPRKGFKCKTYLELL